MPDLVVVVEGRCKQVFQPPHTDDPIPAVVCLPHPSIRSRPLAVQIPGHRAPQLSPALARNVDQVFQIIASREAHLAHEVLRRRLNIPVVAILKTGFVLRPAKVRIAGDRCGSLEALQTLLRFGLRVGIVVVAAEELVGGNGFLVGEFLAGVVVRVI